MRWPYRWCSPWEVAWWFGLAAMIVVAIMFGVRDCNAKDACERRGGEVVETDCTMVWTGKVFVRSCNWICEE